MSTVLEQRVTLSTFGEGRRTSRLTRPSTTVGDVLGEHGVDARGRRVALNGHVADLDRVVRDRDELTVVPRVQGG